MQDDTYVEPDIPQYPMAAATMEEALALADACQAIAERLERLLNLRIATKGTEAYSVMEDFLRIARGVTVECICEVVTKMAYGRHMKAF